MKTTRKPKKNHTSHLANERTFLAWIRTNLGIMAFGFVVEKFSFFVEEIAVILGKAGLQQSGSSLQGYSSIFGISLVSIGALLCVFVYFQYKRTEKQIDDDTYLPSNRLVTLLASFVFLIGVFLIIYLIASKTNVSHYIQ
jgi:putative membrane protein